MAYQIDRYNNTILTIVEDGTINNVTDLKLVGKNYAGYGEIQNENFVFLLENFAGANPPPRAINGQLWYDSAVTKIKYYDGDQWRTTGGSEVDANEPSGLATGDFWWDTNNQQLYVYNGSAFVLIGPQNAGEGITQMESRSLLDNVSGTHPVIAATIEDEVVAIINKDDEFTLNATNPIAGFDKIRKGITLVNTQNAKSGVTQTQGKTVTDLTDWRFHGTATNADKLGGVDASNYVVATPGQATQFTEQVTFTDTGLAIGDSLDFKLYVESGDEGVIQNDISNDSVLKFKVNDPQGILTHSITIDSVGLKAGADATYDIGTTTNKFNRVYASIFDGVATKADTLKVGSDYRIASQSAQANTIVCRTAAGDIAANLFQGTATSAKYADLAEVYSTGEELAVGTVVSICNHDGHEADIAQVSDVVIGVISDKPAYLMNSDAEGQAVALKGRVPVLTKGSVQKGDSLYVDQDGVASTDGAGDLVGVALKTNIETSVKLVEVVLKV